MQLSTRIQKIVSFVALVLLLCVPSALLHAAVAPTGTISVDPITTIKQDSVVITGKITWNKPLDSNVVGTANNKLFLDIGDNANALLTRQNVDLVSNNPSADGKVESSQFSVTISTLDSSTEYFFRIETPGAEASGIKGSFTTAADTSKNISTLGANQNTPASTTTTTTPGTGTVAPVQPTANIGTYDVLDTAVHVSGSIVHPDLVSDVSLKYGTSANALTLGTVQAHIQGFYFSADITGLSPSTKYFVQVVGTKTGSAATGATTAGGDVLSEKIGSFKTLSTGAAGIPLIIDTLGTGVTLGVRDINGGHAVLTGTVGLYKGLVDIYFDKSGTGQNFQFFFSPTINAKRFDEPISGLVPGTSYLAYIGAHGDPSINLTNVLAFSTPAISLSPVFTSLGSTSVTVVADAPEGVVSPTFMYGLSSDAINQSSAMSKNSDGLYSATVNGLTPDTNYYYRIQGTDSGKIIPYTGVFTFLTGKDTGSAAPTIGTIGSNVGGKVASFTGKLIPCDGVDGAGRQTCSFPLFIKLLSNIISFLLFIVAPIIATGLLLYGGFLILTAGDSSEQVSKAKGLFTKGITGLIIAMAAWLIVKFVMVNLGYNSTLFPTFY